MSDPTSDLAAAEAALQQLLTQGGVVKVQHNGKIVSYHPTNLQELKAYVAQLRGSVVNAVRFSSCKGL